MSKAAENSRSEFFRHANKLTIDPVRGEATGNIPEWLEGVLIRNGPGIQQIGPDHYNHLFDGNAVLHRFKIKNGQATYQNRPLECDAYKKNMENQRIIVSEFGTLGVADPCKSLFDRFKASFYPLAEDPSDNCNVNVAFYGDQLYAMTERVFVRRVNPENLKVLGPKVCLRDYMTINHATAHPHILEDGTVLNMGNNRQHKGGVNYCIVKIPPTFDCDETSFKNGKVIAEIPCRWKMYPCYYHSMGMTTNHVLFIEQPYCIDIKKLILSGVFGNTVKDCLAWHKNYKTRIYVTPMEGGETQPLVYETDDLFLFHHINAYEEDGNIIMDVAAYDSGAWVSNLLNDWTKSNPLTGASTRRYVLPLNVDGAKPGKDLVNLKNCDAKATLRAGSDGKIVDCVPHKFTDWFEFPRINYKYNGKKYNIFYGNQATKDRLKTATLPEPDIISKYNITTGELLSWTGKDILASEPVFIPNLSVENPAEDDGVVVAALLHTYDQLETTLLILDAKNMKEIAKVKFNTNGPVPSTFHGMWAQTGEKIHTY